MQSNYTFKIDQTAAKSYSQYGTVTRLLDAKRCLFEKRTRFVYNYRDCLSIDLSKVRVCEVPRKRNKNKLFLDRDTQRAL